LPGYPPLLREKGGGLAEDEMLSKLPQAIGVAAESALAHCQRRFQAWDTS